MRSESKQSFASLNNILEKTIAEICVRVPVWILPLFAGLQGLITCVCVYLSALNRGQVSPFIPYISEAATFPPQAGWFSFLLNVNALLLMIGGIIRYYEAGYLLKKLQQKHKGYTHWANNLFLLVMFGQALFQTCVGSFRSTEHPFIHTTIAILMFGCLLLNQSFTVYISSCLSYEGLEPFPTAIICVYIIQIVMLMSSLITRLLLYGHYDKYTPESGLQQGLTDYGDLIHDISALTQWISILLMFIYYFCHFSLMLNFKKVYKKLKLTIIK